MKQIKLFNCVAGLVVLFFFGTTVAADIDSNWLYFQAGVNYIDTKERVLVAHDRKFSVPFNTLIYNNSGTQVSLESIRVSDIVTIYLAPKDVVVSPLKVSTIVVEERRR